MAKFTRGASKVSNYIVCNGKQCLYLLITLLSCGLSFFMGALNGSVVQTPCEIPNELTLKKTSFSKQSLDDANIEAIVNQRVNAELSKAGVMPIISNRLRFDEGIKNLAQGIVRVKKDEFTKNFDFGTPVNRGDGSKAEVLLFYSSSSAFPSRVEDSFKAQYEGNDGIALLNVTEATANCESVNVITTSNGKYTCTAIVGNHESYHVQRWYRGQSSSLQAVSRGIRDNGGSAFKLPEVHDIEEHQKSLQTYFNHLDEVIAELKPIAERVAKKNTIIVMTCNSGQSELLMNFVCNARSKSLDVSNILVFPTDEDTKKMAEGLGLATFYDKRNFKNMPERAANFYGDRTFVAMMFAKVVCVQLISMLGYDLLFQDVDVIWFRNPLDYFHDESNPFYNFDMYFQDDGAHSARYAPFSANSGFYYARNNDKTRHFFTTLLYSGDIIIRWFSHQQALVQLMAEHASQFGLRVKVLDRDMVEFPGGFHYHSRKNKDYMKKIMKGDLPAEIFHMSWTNNKKDKLKFFQQMGQWYVRKECITKESRNSFVQDNTNLSKPSLTESCCLADAEVICHYRDKPSIIPCKESNPIDKGGRSFW